MERIEPPNQEKIKMQGWKGKLRRLKKKKL